MTDTILAAAYLTCFQLCALPGIVRIIRRKSSADLSIWRELLLLLGCSIQLAVMLRTHAAWQIVVSPLATIASVCVLLFVILKYRT